MDKATSCVLGISLKEDVFGYFGDVRKDLGIVLLVIKSFGTFVAA